MYIFSPAEPRSAKVSCLGSPYPATSTLMHAAVNGTELFYETHGNGPPLLVMHGGMGLDHSYLRPWLDPLKEEVELVFYDHRENGRSARPESWEAVSHQTWVEDTDALREHLGHDKVFLFGHSHGAYLAQEYALHYPERLLGLILCSAAPALDYPDVLMANSQERATPEQLAALASGLSAPVPDDETLRQLWRDLLPLYFHGEIPDEVREQFAGIHYSAEAFNRGFFVCLPEFSTVERLHEITAPTLLLGGADDFMTPIAQGAERIRAAVPSSELVVFEHSGHFPFAEEPERFVCAVRDWLTRLLP